MLEDWITWTPQSAFLLRSGAALSNLDMLDAYKEQNSNIKSNWQPRIVEIVSHLLSSAEN